MILLHIIESLSGYGGTPRKLLYLTKYTDVDVCRHIFLCYTPSSLKKDFEKYGAIVKCIDSISLLSIIRETVRLSKIYEVDAICTHFTRPLITGFIAANIGNIPIIHNEHSSSNYRKGISRYISKFILPRVEKVTCNSYYTKKTVQLDFAVSDNIFDVLYNPVEKRICNKKKSELRNQLRLSRDDLVIGHVGGMIPQRDQKTLIFAFSELKKNFPTAQLIMIGDGILRSQLEEFASQLGIRESVTFTGYTDKIGEYLTTMDIYVNPTLDEGFGIAVVEAMLASLPVVLADTGAHPELIEDGISGVLYRGGDTNSLLHELESLAQAQDARTRMGALAKERALAKFHPQVYADNYIRTVSEVVDLFRLSI